MRGFPGLATSMRRCFWSSRRRRNAPPNCRSSRRWRSTTPSSIARRNCARDLALKWPNDILCGGAKLAGILIEGERPARELAVAIGIGVNCRHHPAQTNYPATDLSAAGADVSAEEPVCRAVRRDGAADRPMASRRRFRRHPRRLDRARRQHGRDAGPASGQRDTGRGEGLDERGRLLLRLADGVTAAGRGRRCLSGRRRGGRSRIRARACRLMAGPSFYSRRSAASARSG